jgi:hypothetical protein
MPRLIRTCQIKQNSKYYFQCNFPGVSSANALEKSSSSSILIKLSDIMGKLGLEFPLCWLLEDFPDDGYFLWHANQMSMFTLVFQEFNIANFPQFMFYMTRQEVTLTGEIFRIFRFKIVGFLRYFFGNCSVELWVRCQSRVSVGAKRCFSDWLECFRLVYESHFYNKVDGFTLIATLSSIFRF